MSKKFKRVLVANRGEIAIRVIRACKELGIRTVAIYSEEDRTALFRTKADEAYQIGNNKGPIEAYLAIDEIIDLAIKKDVDAIHPGYGFLSENPEFVRQCEAAGIKFIGPDAEVMEKLGDKIKSKILAQKFGVPTIPGLEKPIKKEEEIKQFAEKHGYPLILKAAAGGGGRGMRIVRSDDELIAQFRDAKEEARKAFGVDDIFVERYLENPKHIEVQILGDEHGNLVHLFERDCSIQRRHQKLVEFTPAVALSDEKRQAILKDALKLCEGAGYKNAGTVEFLVDKYDNHYFIEVNPRIQVEHTVSEMVTGIDIVQSQVLVAEGYRLDSEEINIPNQESIKVNGYSIQCRVTTEDPANNFIPDTGRLDHYRTGSGYGIRLDGGNGYTGAIINPYYDSLLVKTISWSRTFPDAIRKAMRSVEEMKVRGVKTNASFLINVLNHKEFQKGTCDTGFISNNPELLDVRPGSDQEQKILSYLGEKIVNETRGKKPNFDVPKVPEFEKINGLEGTKQILDQGGAEAVVEWIKDKEEILLTDTTYRDAHQSLMATRMRTVDMEKIAEATSHLAKDLFSLEMWGGATFDVSYRFLKESPWERIERLREKIPNILFQMLLRGSNGVGYKNYPDNVIRNLVAEAADAGIDVFRIFDSLNWLPAMEVSIDEVVKQGKIAEVSMCYTGDILNDKRDKYDLDYYLDLAKGIEAMGAHILGIKDMAGLLKPYAAYELIKALKAEISIPIHLHTHDTSGNGGATLLMAAEAGVDIIDTAFNTMAGLTSQPPLNSIVAALTNTYRDPKINIEDIQKISNYWGAVRPVYSQFESELKSGTAEIYKYEIPGGQYSNLKPQVESVGLGHRFKEFKEMYRKVNFMLGDIPKVTPSSKMVGDLAIFMVKNDLTPDNICEKGKNMAFPDSVEAYFKGMLGQPPGGFPEDIQKIVLKGEEPITVRPGTLLEDYDFETAAAELKEEYDFEPTQKELLAYALYPKVYKDYLEYLEEYGDLSHMGSDVYFHALREGETSEIKVEEGKTLIVKLLEIAKVDDQGFRRLVFEVNGFRREIKIYDEASTAKVDSAVKQMADPKNEMEIGASLPGNIVEILIEEGEEVEENQSLVIMEAMKMETNITAPAAGKVAAIHAQAGQQLESGELILELE
ncbi:pyruvate carboxylase [Halanaerobium congolense]|jgi:pyruvate carboxylase|uniref:Pyruvate carboxylase n=1 Tax=Halanaerobium congolense TaxID=54121 RepID=A0A1G6MD61_9FIRM|nr:pyruvate carboxylase [Halanaerobium congolense]PTX17258.1 pyruvate carboxylase [Halanaerobium congolense]TDP25653.1 pyruvate carboxylase [Halanaerobium congolense]SDC53433.1 pyruvate carboxylase [Halanaerobium congolense]SDF10240.1 pyruvate carboxylase [Halanaerobium congolense]SES82315.1 pyruvate carboxylase [Halanaerobium congolense]